MLTKRILILHLITLLLTVTATIFVEQPLEKNNKTSFRILMYFAAVCIMLFIMSIMTGIFFIENAMSRAYSHSDRFVLIIKYFIYKTVSQYFMCIGSALFPIVLAIPMWELYIDIDANILIAFTMTYIVVGCYIIFLQVQVL